MKERLVLEDIARALGVSKTTVSRAISGTGRVSKETRERVLAYVAETGFVPNATANNLATTRTHNIAYSMPIGENSIVSTYFLECLFGVSKVAAECGYHVVIVDDSMEALCRAAGSHKVDGLVLSAFTYGDEAMRRLVDYGLPVVLTGRSDVPGVLQIGYDGDGAYAVLVKQLMDSWQCRMALLLTEEGYPANMSRANGFLSAMHKHGVKDARICWNVIGKEILQETVMTLYNQGIHGLICGDDAICSDLLPILSHFATSNDPLQRQLAQEIRVASFHSSRILRDFHPEIPTVNVDPMQMGQEAARVAIREIEERGINPSYTELPYEIHIGE